MAAAVRGKSRGSRTPSGPKAKNDAYTGMLILALVAQLAAGIFLVMDYMKYPDKKPDALPKPPALTSEK